MQDHSPHLWVDPSGRLFGPHVAGTSGREGGNVHLPSEIESIEVLLGTHKEAHQELLAFTMPPEQEHNWCFDLMTIDGATAGRYVLHDLLIDVMIGGDRILRMWISVQSPMRAPRVGSRRRS